MSLNDKGNLVNKISNMNEEELNKLDLKVYLVSKARETDNLYNAKKEQLKPVLRDWLRNRLKKELESIKFENENNNKKFYVSDYNHELVKTDYIAKLDLNDDKLLRSKKNKLIQAILISENIEDKEVKFQVIETSIDDESIYFIYYRGVKASAVAKKNAKIMPAIRERDHLIVQEKDIIEFGGKIELIISKDYLYVIKPTTLHYTFDYTDHIFDKRNKNLETITSMKFFDDYSNINFFMEKSNIYILSKSWAGISEETLDILEESFDERCIELREIKEKIPDDKENKEIYQKKYESLWPLYDHIDVNNKKVRFNNEKSVTPLLHFFSDKIVESFLTKGYRAG